MKIYIATPVGDSTDPKRAAANEAADILMERGFEVYCPWGLHIPHAWNYPNNEWGQMVFANDIAALENCDAAVMLSYGRESTAGANWEAGYLYARSKKIIVVEMTDNIMSIMVSNGCYARVKGLNGLRAYDFNTMPMLRTDTEQK